MLKSYLARQGLALESEEVQDEALETSIAAVETAHDEVEETHEEIEAAEDGATTLESLVLTFESAPGHRTALEKHLFKCMVAEQYKKIGIATPYVPSLESAEHTYLSMEEEKGVIKKVVDAIKDAWARFKAMIRDFWAKLTDTAGKLNKKFEALKKGDGKDVTITDEKISSHGLYIKDILGCSKELAQFFKDAGKTTHELIDHCQREYRVIGNITISFQQPEKVSQKFEAELKTPFDTDANHKQGAFTERHGVLVSAGLELTKIISDYHRDWKSRDKSMEDLLTKLRDGKASIKEHVGRNSDKYKAGVDGRFGPIDYLRWVRDCQQTYANLTKYANRGAAQGIRVAKIILDAVS